MITLEKLEINLRRCIYKLQDIYCKHTFDQKLIYVHYEQTS